MPEVACRTCGIRSYCDGPQTTCEACVGRLRAVAEAAEKVCLIYDWDMRIDRPNPCAELALVDAISALKRGSCMSPTKER
jgi:hypothetical protein